MIDIVYLNAVGERPSTWAVSRMDLFWKHINCPSHIKQVVLQAEIEVRSKASRPPYG